MVRCKFVCTEHREFKYGQETLHGYKFSPVTQGSEENKAFFKWTPSGSLEFGTVQAQAFEIGKEYYLDLSPAEQI
jgi:hypothetical protein